MGTPVLTTALEWLRGGASVIPIEADGSKAPPRGFSWGRYQQTAPAPDQIGEWFDRGRGLAVLGGIASHNLEWLDFDNWEIYETYVAAARAMGLGALVDRIEAGYSERTPRPGMHWAYRCAEIGGNEKLAMRPKPPAASDEVKADTLIETRGQGGYCIVAPSNATVHESGRPYVLLDGGPSKVATITPVEREQLLGLARTFNEVPPDTERERGQPHRDISGGRPGDAFNSKASWSEILEPHGWVLAHGRGQVDYWRRPGKSRGWSATTGHAGTDYLYVFSSATAFEAERGYSKFSAYAVLNHNGDFRAAAEALAAEGYGEPRPRGARYEPIEQAIDPLTGEVRDDWPKPLAEEAFYGLAGEIIRGIAPHSEADEAALLAHLITGVGAMIGARVFARAGDAIHPARINAAIVGETSKGRKGSAARPNERLLEMAEPSFIPARVGEGLSSGEGLIWAVRDPIYKYERVGGKGGDSKKTELVMVDPGIEDKRLWVVESEFASALRVLQRDGNTLSTLVRRAWDSGDLKTMTKTAPAVSTGAHICIVGHVTKDELLRYLDRSELASGFANRYLWVASRRGRILPDGEGVPYAVLEPLAERLREVWTWAGTMRQMYRDAEASAIWRDVYASLSAGQPGMFGAATNRSEAQVLRLSVWYAAMDRSAVIRAEHLLAALAVWEYCEQSARWIFGDSTGDPHADAILTALRQNSPQTRTDLTAIFGRNLSRATIDQSLALLLRLGRVRRDEDRDTGGRPKELWHVV